MTNPKRGEMRLELAGKRFDCRITMDVMIRVETAIGKSILKVASDLQNADMTALQMVAFLTPVLRSSGEDIREKDVQSLLWDAGLPEGLRAIAEVIAFLIGGVDNEGNEPVAVNS